jgi:3-isopropylmalate dehydrogenase
MFLSAAMMLDWLGEKHDVAGARNAGALITRAVDSVFASGRMLTCEFGGDAGTAAVAKAVLDAINEGAGGET